MKWGKRHIESFNSYSRGILTFSSHGSLVSTQNFDGSQIINDENQCL